jgi:uncharacterized protein YndB with AHSA1/START domain
MKKASLLGFMLLAAAGEEVKMLAEKPSDRTIVLSRSFAAPQAKVFAALTRPEHLLRWMQPAKMPLVAAEVDLREGGSFRYTFGRPSGAKIEVRGAYSRVDAPNGFAYLESYDFSPLVIEVETSLEKDGERTVFRQTLTYASPEARDEDFPGVSTSAAEVYAKLEQYLAEMPSP